MRQFNIISPGGYTTVQDLGRTGYSRYGVPVSGALDSFSARVANLLVGNPESAALLELTIMGPSLEIMTETDIALTGAKMPVSLNKTPIPPWTAFRAVPGDILTIGQVRSGCRGYLAFGGGIDVPKVMGSCSTYAGGALGGFRGRSLMKGDMVNLHPAELLHTPRQVPKDFIPAYPDQIRVRVVPGPQGDFFDMDQSPLFAAPYMVTAKADRMGYRLQGEKIPITQGMPKSIVSEPAVPGSIQIPPDEQPIILLVEQTVGGYAKIATIISTDLPRVAQATPGDTIGFEKVDIEQAHTLYRLHMDILDQIKAALLK